MRIFRRRSTRTSKEEALAEAREAIASARRDKADLERYRSKKQAQPADAMTPNQWLGSGSRPRGSMPTRDAPHLRLR